MPVPARHRTDEISKLAEALPGEELVEVCRNLFEHVGDRLSENQLLDLAARTLAAHPGLSGRLQALRSLLAVTAGWRGMVEELAGEPRWVFDPERLADSSLKQVRIAAEAVAAIWDEELLPSSEAARRLGAKASNREKINAYRRRSMLLGLPRGQRYLYPAFQIDAARQEICPEVQEVNRLLGAAADPWGVASWWVSVNGRLGARPLDLVGTEQSSGLVEAAKSAVELLG